MSFETLLITLLASAAVGGLGQIVTIVALDLLLRRIHRDRHAEWVDIGKPVGYFFRPPERKVAWATHGFHLLHTLRLFLWGGLTEPLKSFYARPLRWIRVVYMASVVAFLLMLGCWIGIAMIFANLG